LLGPAQVLPSDPMNPPRDIRLLWLLASACSHTASPGAAVRVAANEEAGAADRSSSSDDAAAETGSVAKTETLTVMAGGQPRIIIVHSPPNPGGPVPLVFNLHGSGGTAADQEVFSGMDQAADALGFVAAYPQGAIALGSGFAWNVPGQPLSGGGAVPPDAADDVLFFAQTVAAIEQRYPVDPKRIYAAGFSGGGRMASQLGCDLSSIVAAVAPVAGLRFPSPCSGERPVPVVAFHGTADAVNPYDGGGPPYWTYSVPSAAEQWAAHDGCGPTPTTSQPAASVALTSYVGCTGSATVDLYTIEGAGHEWPGAPQQTNAVDATAVMWTFFSTHPLP